MHEVIEQEQIQTGDELTVTIKLKVLGIYPGGSVDGKLDNGEVVTLPRRFFENSIVSRPKPVWKPEVGKPAWDGASYRSVMVQAIDGPFAWVSSGDNRYTLRLEYVREPR